MNTLLEYKDYLVKWIQEQVAKANCNGVIVGMSGGVDSSVVAALAKEAFPNDSLGVYLPVGNMGQDFDDAKAVADKINIKTVTVDLTAAFEATHKATGVEGKLASANIKPRLRMTALYALAQENKYLVLGTDNAAEWLLGYFTKYGDGGVDILPIVHMTKGEVKQLAKELELPEIVYTKAPTAALWDGQTDEEELGYSYDEVDKYLNGETISDEIKAKIELQKKITEHKRKALPMPSRLKTFKTKENMKNDFNDLKNDIKGLFRRKK